MAAGYARASGRVGVVMVTSGPGATNCVTPVRDCMADSIPIVVICGQVPRPAIGTDAFQEAPIFNIMSACSKHVFLVEDESELEATVRSAFDIARSGRPGPVVVVISKNILDGETGEVTIPKPSAPVRMGPEPAAMEAAVRLINEAKRPIILAGEMIAFEDATAELTANQSSVPATNAIRWRAIG